MRWRLITGRRPTPTNLGEARDWNFQVECSACRVVSLIRCRDLVHRLAADLSLAEVEKRLNCRRCHAKPASVTLREPLGAPLTHEAVDDWRDAHMRLRSILPDNRDGEVFRYAPEAGRPLRLLIKLGMSRIEVSAEEAYRLGLWLVRSFRNKA